MPPSRRCSTTSSAMRPIPSASQRRGVMALLAWRGAEHAPAEAVLDGVPDQVHDGHDAGDDRGDAEVDESVAVGERTLPLTGGPVGELVEPPEEPGDEQGDRGDDERPQGAD